MLFLMVCATRLGNDVGGFSGYGCQVMVVDVLVYQRIKKRNLVVAFHLHGDVDSLLLRVHIQKKVVDSGSCGDYKSVINVSLLNSGKYSGGQDLRAC